MAILAKKEEDITRLTDTLELTNNIMCKDPGSEVERLERTARELAQQVATLQKSKDREIANLRRQLSSWEKDAGDFASEVLEKDLEISRLKSAHSEGPSLCHEPKKNGKRMTVCFSADDRDAVL